MHAGQKHSFGWIARWGVTTLAGFVAALALASCGGNSASPVQQAKPTKPSEAVQSALRNPASAASTVATFYGYLQSGALPASLDLYSPSVPRAVQLGNFAGALAFARTAALDQRLNVITQARVGKGLLVSAETIPRDGPKAKESFYLLRRASGWRIVYDTVSASSLQSFVQEKAQRAIAPSAQKPSARALRAGDQAIALYRQVALGTSP